MGGDMIYMYVCDGYNMVHISKNICNGYKSNGIHGQLELDSKACFRDSSNSENSFLFKSQNLTFFGVGDNQRFCFSIRDREEMWLKQESLIF